MAAVARAAGFGSVRQMNRVMESIFRFGPTELRAKRRGRRHGRRRRPATADPVRGAVPSRGDARPPSVPGHARGRTIEGPTYLRTVEVCGNPGVIEVDLGRDESHLALTAHLPTFDSIIDDVTRVRAMFGLDDDVVGAEAHLIRDPLLAAMVTDQAGCE
ncbi:MAG: AlkA N-terminal domain-containing protein [Acidimicrobiales bacterium]